MKLAFYPLTGHTALLLQYLELFRPEFTITSVMSPAGYAGIGKDAGYALNQAPMGYSVEQESLEGLAECDGIFVADGGPSPQIRSCCIKMLQEAVRLQKKIFCSMRLSSEEKNSISGIAANFTQYDFLNDFSGEAENSVSVVSVKTLHRVSTPVIFIGGLVEEADTLAVFLSLVSRLKHNFKCLAVGARDECGLLGLRVYPKSFSSRETAEEDKVYDLNQYFYEIENEENPDVIVVQVRGGMIKFSEDAPNGFGIPAYLLSAAITPDYFILCAPNGMGCGDVLEMLNGNFAHRFGYSADCVHISNVVFDSFEMKQTGKLAFTHTKQDDIASQLSEAEASIPLYNLINRQDMDILCREIESLLSVTEKSI